MSCSVDECNKHKELWKDTFEQISMTWLAEFSGDKVWKLILQCLTPFIMSPSFFVGFRAFCSCAHQLILNKNNQIYVLAGYWSTQLFNLKRNPSNLSFLTFCYKWIGFPGDKLWEDGVPQCSTSSIMSPDSFVGSGSRGPSVCQHHSCQRSPLKAPSIRDFRQDSNIVQTVETITGRWMI